MDIKKTAREIDTTIKDSLKDNPEYLEIYEGAEAQRKIEKKEKKEKKGKARKKS